MAQQQVKKHHTRKRKMKTCFKEMNARKTLLGKKRKRKTKEPMMID
jgi:hypothetical protein